MSRTNQKSGHHEVIAQINDRLKAAAVPVTVEANGRYLVLRATLPCKPGDGQGRKRYKLSLGIPANSAGLKRAEAKAQALGDELARGVFDWANWQNPRREKVADSSTRALIERYKADYFLTRRITEASWTENQARTFAKLPQEAELTEAAILAIVWSTEPHTRSREVACQRLQGLARYAGLEVDLGPYKGDYSDRSTAPRELPSDAQIEQCRELIPNESWQWVYGVLAAFGLRPHEVFRCEFAGPLKLKVWQNTKTGDRTARAILPEWAERWNLVEVNRPSITGDTPRKLGQAVSQQFWRYGLPFHAYDLRHAYAVRGSVVKALPVSTMAAMMGHSASLHTKIYHRWLSDATNDEVYRRMVLGEDSAR